MDGAKQRVEQELKELESKQEALKKFLSSDKYNELSAEMRILLHRQYSIMAEYSLILFRRLEIWDRG